MLSSLYEKKNIAQPKENTETHALLPKEGYDLRGIVVIGS